MATGLEQREDGQHGAGVRQPLLPRPPQRPPDGSRGAAAAPGRLSLPCPSRTGGLCASPWDPGAALGCHQCLHVATSSPCCPRVSGPSSVPAQWLPACGSGSRVLGLVSQGPSQLLASLQWWQVTVGAHGEPPAAAGAWSGPTDPLPWGQAAAESRALPERS